MANGKGRRYKLGAGLLALVATVMLGWLTHLPAEAQPTSAPAQWTPVVASALTPTTQAVLGVDGQYHIVYELVLTNTSAYAATLNGVDIVAEVSGEPLASVADDDLLSRLRAPGSFRVPTAELGPSESRLVLLDQSFSSRDAVPDRLIHRLDILGTAGPARREASPLSYAAAPIAIASAEQVLGPPLKGAGWVAINGCCSPDVGHRSTGLPTAGAIHFAQRFAIDWMQLDRQGRIAVGDLADVRSYPSYGAELLAVADGTVVQTRDDLPDQVPPTLPAPSTIDLTNVLGNNVILDLGDGAYALYAHLQPGSVQVKTGDRVRKGQVLGRLGNTGNTSAPHLHFHLMAGPTLASDGLPYTFDRFEVAGQIPLEEVEQFYSFEGNWRSALLPQPSPRQREFPLFLTVVNFPE
ncbi:M23 family metallopeptidase [Nodosilinea nodulosa]|uniref:M23 family metallopeptidase n=1 Tax=Nodosilinea nodulosa TaxID=416001 RepID=UPI0002FA9D6B|nr:M23 family metallopeptidase [Nodosilinea nodulosa]